MSARKRLEPRGRTQGPSLRSEYIRGTVEKTLKASGIFKKRYRPFNRTNMFTFNNSPLRGAAVNDSESIYSPPKGGAGGRGPPSLGGRVFVFQAQQIAENCQNLSTENLFTETRHSGTKNALCDALTYPRQMKK